MLYVYHGSDIEKARTKVRKTIESLRAKQPNATYMRVYGDEFLTTDTLELTASQGLFKSAYIVLLDSILASADAEKRFAEALVAFADAEHVFLLLQDSIDEKLLAQIAKKAQKVDRFDVHTAPQKAPLNPFALTDALLARDAGGVFAQLYTATKSGRPPEETLGTLFWAAKSIVLAHTARSATDAGLKEFPFKKAQRAAQKFSRTEARQLMCALATAQADAYTQGVPLELMLERILISCV
jgi:DNA polymerase III delta subunit